MVPVKKEGWVNIYYGYNGVREFELYECEEDAMEEKSGNYITTIKVEWEE